jgi:hypothetical protein
MPKVVIAEDEFMNLDMIAEILADSGYDVATLPGRCRKGSNSASGISPNLPPSIHTLLIAALSRARGSYGTRYYGSGSNGYGSYGPQYYGSDYNGSGYDGAGYYGYGR